MKLKPQFRKSGISRKIAYTILPLAIMAVLAFASGAWSTGPTTEQSAGEALQAMLDGNKLYVADHSVRPDKRPSDAKQAPRAVILSCSDSRVAPTILFDQGVGSLFVVRTAGNTYDQLGLESMGYAVHHLHSRLIIVLGHDQCGAVAAAVAEYPKPTKKVMLNNIYPAVAKIQGEPGDPVSNAVSENAVLTAERLAHEPKFAALVKSGDLKIVPARYHLANGSVTLLPEDEAAKPTP
jgi:carbonic anhydrase